MKLKGDVIIAAVAGEIEKTQWGEFNGKEYRGYGVGTHYLVNHGVLPDMCILGEPTDMQVVLEHFGSMWVRISVTGIYVHTAFAKAARNEFHPAYGRCAGDSREMDQGLGEESDLQGTQRLVNLGCNSRRPPLARQPHSRAH